MAVAILMLQTFARKRRSSSRAAEQKSARAHIGCGPDEVRNALESEHRVVDEEWNRIDAVRRIGGARRDARSHRAGFRNALLENLSVLRFLVIEQSVYIHGFILLADARINTGSAEK